MKKICDVCGHNAAEFFIATLENGTLVTKGYCTACATALGLDMATLKKDDAPTPSFPDDEEILEETAGSSIFPFSEDTEDDDLDLDNEDDDIFTINVYCYSNLSTYTLTAKSDVSYSLI